MTLQTIEELGDVELDRIERRVAAATIGPWMSYVAGRDADADGSFIELGSCNEVGTFKAIELVGATPADQDFIANARQDIPKLLQAVRQLRACLQSLCADIHEPDAQTLRSAVDTSSLPLSQSM